MAELKKRGGQLGNRGNKGASGTKGNLGNTAPMFARNISPQKAEQIKDFYNAEATYHPEVTAEAFGHLKDLQDHVNQLAQSSTSPYAQIAQAHVAQAAQAHAAHSYWVSEGDRAKGGTDVFEHINNTMETLHNMKSDPTVLPELHPFIDRAIGHGQAYLDKLSPAKVISGKTEGTASTAINPGYRARANVDTTLDKKKFGDTYRGFANADALYQKRTLPAEQQKKAKKYVKPKSTGFAEAAPTAAPKKGKK